jgi:hypothetical protein
MRSVAISLTPCYAFFDPGFGCKNTCLDRSLCHVVSTFTRATVVQRFDVVDVVRDKDRALLIPEDDLVTPTYSY